MSPCVVCGAVTLEPHLRVRPAGDATLEATTTAYGSAPADIVRCRACGHMQVAAFPSEAVLEESYGAVDQPVYVDEEDGQRATARRVLATIEGHRAPGSLLDLGCWVGFLVSEADRRGWHATGVEPSRFASEYARTTVGADVVCATIDSPGLGERRFGAVFLGDVIEHLPDPGAALDRIAALLEPGGVLCLALPDAGSRVARVLGRRWWSVLPTHVQYFTRASLTRLLEGRGYAVESVATAPKGFTVGYYLERLAGYSRPLARLLVGVARATGVAGRMVFPDFGDRMLVVARVGRQS